MSLDWETLKKCKVTRCPSRSNMIYAPFCSDGSSQKVFRQFGASLGPAWLIEPVRSLKRWILSKA